MLKVYEQRLFFAFHLRLVVTHTFLSAITQKCHAILPCLRGLSTVEGKSKKTKCRNKNACTQRCPLTYTRTPGQRDQIYIALLCSQVSWGERDYKSTLKGSRARSLLHKRSLNRTKIKILSFYVGLSLVLQIMRGRAHLIQGSCRVLLVFIIDMLLVLIDCADFRNFAQLGCM